MKTILILVAMLSMNIAYAGGYKVVAGPGVPDKSLTKEELKQIVLGNKQYWSDKTRIVVFLGRKGSADRKAALGVVGMSELVFNRHWVGKQFRGEARAPKTFMSVNFGVELAKAVPGSIMITADGASTPGLDSISLK